MQSNKSQFFNKIEKKFIPFLYDQTIKEYDFVKQLEEFISTI